MKKLIAVAVLFAGLLAGIAWVTSANAAPPGPQYVSASQTTDPALIPNSANPSLIEDSYPDVTVNGWRVVYDEGGAIDSSPTVQVTAWAVCD